MSHTDSPTGQQFRVRYNKDKDGEVLTLWGHAFDTREEAEESRQVYEDFRAKNGRIYNIRIFVRDLSPWREDEPPQDGPECTPCLCAGGGRKHCACGMDHT